MRCKARGTGFWGAALARFYYGGLVATSSRGTAVAQRAVGGGPEVVVEAGALFQGIRPVGGGEGGGARVPRTRRAPMQATVAPHDWRAAKVPRTAEPALMASSTRATDLPCARVRRAAGRR